MRVAARNSSGPAYLVGGALRDAVLGRALTDIDLAASDARSAARRLAKNLKASLVCLDEKHQVFRVVLGKRHVDIAALQGRLEDDLRRRDFTLNALALPLSSDFPREIPLEKIIDLRGGLQDIQRKHLRAESAMGFHDDPLRILRAFRIAAQLDFVIEPRTLGLIKKCAKRVSEPAGERLRAELLALASVPGCSRWLSLMDDNGVLTSLFKELEDARRCALVYYGKGGVLKHSLDTAARADFLLNNVPSVYPETAASIQDYLHSRSTDLSPHKAVLILAALLHDIAKASTAKRLKGRLRFFGHDIKGAAMASALLKRLRFSGEEIACVNAVITHHLRPGNLAAGGSLTDKAAYRFFRDTDPYSASLLLVCWSDHASYLPETTLLRSLSHARSKPDARGLSKVRPPEARKTLYHLQVISHLLNRFFAPAIKPLPDPLIDGHGVMRLLGIPPGPQVGRLLEKLRETQALGHVKTRADAERFLRRCRR